MNVHLVEENPQPIAAAKKSPQRELTTATMPRRREPFGTFELTDDGA